VWLSSDIHQQRFAADPQQLPEFFASDRDQIFVGQIGQFGLARSADEKPGSAPCLRERGRDT
jgi:hypothetical protein